MIHDFNAIEQRLIITRSQKDKLSTRIASNKYSKNTFSTTCHDLEDKGLSRAKSFNNVNNEFRNHASEKFGRNEPLNKLREKTEQNLKKQDILRARRLLGTLIGTLSKAKDKKKEEVVNSRLIIVKKIEEKE